MLAEQYQSTIAATQIQNFLSYTKIQAWYPLVQVATNLPLAGKLAERGFRVLHVIPFKINCIHRSLSGSFCTLWAISAHQVSMLASGFEYKGKAIAD